MALTSKQARNREMFELRSKGWTLAQLSDRYKISIQACHQALADWRKNHIPEESKEDVRALVSQIYTENINALYAIIEAGPIPAYSNGRPIVEEDEDGNPVKVLDWSGVMKARDQVVKITEQMRKMLGADDATKIETSGEIRHTIIGIPVEDV